jgi:hypothetical protein
VHRRAAHRLVDGLFKGTNTVLLDRPNDGRHLRHNMQAFASDAAMVTVVRIAALLDRGVSSHDDTISFQVIFRWLARPEVSAALIADAVAQSDVIFPDRQEAAARRAMLNFDAAYRSLDWSKGGAVSRLKHLRNLGVAHLTLKEVTTSITYDELEFMARAVGEMAEALLFFADDNIMVSAADIDVSARDARNIWEAVYEAL